MLISAVQQNDSVICICTVLSHFWLWFMWYVICSSFWVTIYLVNILKWPTSHNLLGIILNQSTHTCWITPLYLYWLVFEKSLKANRHPLVLWMCSAAQLCPALCNPMNCKPTRFLCPWDSASKNTEVRCHFLFQGFSRPRDWTCVSCLLPWQADSLPLSHLGNPSFG